MPRQPGRWRFCFLALPARCGGLDRLIATVVVLP
jgi:hypothetical protein